ncbi:P-loop containing nucleoside triphosphate hydrolase protein [Dissophora ornata]|nr:P-loop containing nucleoside triphosphate hydrolase protein [Dissophora ornata]
MLPDIFLKQDIFQHEFQIPIPVKAQRQDMMEALMASMSGTDVEENMAQKPMASRAAQMTSGYVAKDMRNLYRSALLHSLRQEHSSKSRGFDVEQLVGHLSRASLNTNNVVQESLSGSVKNLDQCQTQGLPGWGDFAYAIETSSPSQQIEFESLVRPRRSNYGGYTGLRKRVNQAIHWPITNPETFKRMGVKPPMGLLLYGPSGCGKTMLVQTLAAESSMNFIPIKGPEIFSKYLGETEATLRRLFAMAHQIAPCILFFDEMDSIGAKRGWGGDGDSQGSNGVNERVLSTLLNEMDGVEERTGVFVIGCTNQPRAMDDALMRPGRLDQLIYVGYPTLQDRADIINTIGERIPLPKDLETRTKLAKLTVGFSPADLDALFREAAILSLRRDIATRHVDLCDVDEVARTMSPSVQDRIDKSALRNPDGWDVVVPDLYRQFQQGLRE